MTSKKEMQKMKMASSEKKNFVVNDDEMSCMGDTLDPLGCCITVGETRDGTLINRLLLCGFAVVLLWASSFQTAVYIANSAISSPLFESVQDSCSAAYDLAQSEDSDYTACVDRQMQDCDEAFEEVLNIEVASTNEKLTSNAATLQVVAGYQQLCSDSFLKGQKAISTWVATDLDYEVSYTCPSDENDDGPSTNPYCNASCSYAEAENVFNAKQNGESSYEKYQSCTCAEVADMVGDISALRQAAFATATEYSELSQSTVGSLVDYSLAKAKYDRIYAYNKTEPLRASLLNAMNKLNNPFILDMNFTFPSLFNGLDLSMACGSMQDQQNFTSCLLADFESLHSLYQGVKNDYLAQLERVKEGVSEYYDEAETLTAEVQDSYDSFMVFYNGVQDALDSSITVQTDDGLPWLNIVPGDFVSDFPSWPSTVGVLSGVGSVPGAEYIYGSTAQALASFGSSLAEASQSTTAAAEAFGEAMYQVVQELNALGFEDYDPPQYADFKPEDSDADDEVQLQQEHEEGSDAFVEEQASSLNAFSELNEYVGDDAELSEYNLSYSIGDDFTFSSVDFRFEGFTPNTIDWDLVTLGIARIMNLLLAMDFMYRFFKTMYYIRKFWSRAGLVMPDVDIRQDKYELDLTCGGAAGAGASSGGSGCIACILCPCWAPCLCLFFVVIILINVVLLYIPVVNEYSQVCVKGNGNYTFLTANLYSISLNYAAEGGNEDMIDGIEEYNVRLADYCGAYVTFSQTQQQEDELLLKELQASHDNTRNDLLLINQCVNTTVMDEYFNLACCGEDLGDYPSCNELNYGNLDEAWLKGAVNRTCPLDSKNIPFPLLSTLLNPYSEDTAAATCLEDPEDWELDDASFYCSSLPTCEITCDGPNKELLKVATEQCGCMTEWMMHTWWAQVAGALVVYVIMNISREILLSGITRLCWRWMSPNCFTYRATTTLDGYYIGPPFSSKYPSFKKMLNVELARELKEYEYKGWFFLLLGCGINYLWVYYFVYFSDDRLYYDPNAN